MLKIYEEPVIEEVYDEITTEKEVRLFIKREDKIHPYISGNKWRKLKYNLEYARQQNFSTLLTFGGAYSNHIYATAAAAKEYGFKSIGIIRGEEHLPLNPTLSFASQQGMHLHYMDRSTYRRKHDTEVIGPLTEKYGRFYLLPEGGTNLLAIKGASEIVNEEVRQFDYVCTPVGTGGTIAGIISGMNGRGRVMGFSALKGDFLKHDVQKLLQLYEKHPLTNWDIKTSYHFGGYAKVSPVLFGFIDEIYKKHQIPLDPIYTGKMMFGIYDMIRSGEFAPKTKILTIHTGGLQGVEGMRR
ncbi:1-aminocyclopropane-1-carboxylate deaminase [Fulvivirga imtechensis AK7]|uniref:1-aminocyclopropane-1-carboxylate deaminase n=1 Tax=Fulvivirga imtechensis AK7 TaxID=1237149 RepID=L8JQP1_9BACT|nr:pyridoxal-phosphate dependent enzyme [Fulvivirga imtechensis]ELR69784.1 1-aminocyclopropane-1-carboxylate deaminase [Fulvivirga imtechensis AK7]